MNATRPAPWNRKLLVFGSALTTMVVAGCLTPALIRLGGDSEHATGGPGKPALVEPAKAAAAAAPVPQRESVPDRHVIMIAVDGLRPDAIDAQRTPNLARLIENGAFGKARNILPCCTLPNHAAMITGLDASGHGLTENWYLGERRLGVPTIFDSAYAAGMTTAMYYGKTKFAVFEREGTLDKVVRGWDGCEVVREFCRDFPARRWNLSWVCFPDADSAGHYYGWMSPRYLQTVQMIDGFIGMMLASVAQAGLAGKVHIILTADHGGTRYDHWDDIPEHRTIPFLIAGPTVKPGFRLDIDGPICTTDFAPTAARLLGVQLRREPVGRALVEALTDTRIARGFGFVPTVPASIPERIPYYYDTPSFDDGTPEPEFPEQKPD